MRVLVWPTYSYAGNVYADSLYLIARNLLREVDHGIWDLVVPMQLDNRDRYPPDELAEHPNVRLVHRPMPVLYRVQEATPDPEVIWAYAPQDGLWPVEALVSMSPIRTLSIVNAWSARNGPTSMPFVVNYDLLVRDDGAGEMTTDPVELMQQAAGCWAADLNVFESPIAEKMTLDVCRQFLSPSALTEVRSKCVLVPQGIPVARLSETIAGVPKREKFTVYYGGRFSTSKRVNELAEVFDTAYRFGRDIEFVVTTGSLDGQKEFEFRKRFPEVELQVGLSQEDAWRVMASCHASICFSSHELFGMAFWEQMAAGLAVVMKTERWNRELLPPYYPLVVLSGLDAGVKLRLVHESWKEGIWGWDFDNVHAQWVREHYDSWANLRQVVSLVEQGVMRRRVEAFDAMSRGARRALGELAQQVMEQFEEKVVPWHSIVEAVRENSRVGHNVVGAKLKWARSNTMLDLYRVLLTLGWTESIDPQSRMAVWRRTRDL